MPGLRPNLGATITAGETWTAVGAGPITVSSKTCIIYSLSIRNPTAGALTFTIVDINPAGALTIINAKSLAADAQFDFTSPDGEGFMFNGGLVLSVSATGLVYCVNGRYRTT